MTQFPNTNTSLPFEPRSNVAEVAQPRRDNQSSTGSGEDSSFSRALDDSDARAEVSRDETRAPAQERPAGETDIRNNQDEAAPLENSAEQNDGLEIGTNTTEPETETIEGTENREGASENITINVNSFAFADIPEFVNPFALAQQVTVEAAQSVTAEALQTNTPLLSPTAIEGLLPSGEIAGSLITPQQNLAASLLNGSTAPQTGQQNLGTPTAAQLDQQNLDIPTAAQLGQQNLGTPTAAQPGQLNQVGDVAQNVTTQINSAATQVNNLTGNPIGDAFETVLSTQNGTGQTGVQSLTNLQQNAAASSLPLGQLGDVTLQGSNPNASTIPIASPNPNASPNPAGNLTSAEGETFGSLANANQSTATPSQQLASLLSSTANADVALPNQGQVANTQLQQTVQQPIQQAAQPLAQFANTAFANDTLPAFTAQISRNFAAGQDSFNVRLNPSELGRVDVRIINNDDGTVSTQIRVERSETLDLFQRDIRALERTLQQSGVKLGSDGIDLSLKDNGTDQGGNSQAFDNDFDSQGEHAQNSDPALEANEANQHLDNDGLLVDDLTADIPIDQVQTIYARYQPGQLNIRV